MRPGLATLQHPVRSTPVWRCETSSFISEWAGYNGVQVDGDNVNEVQCDKKKDIQERAPGQEARAALQLKPGGRRVDGDRLGFQGPPRDSVERSAAPLRTRRGRGRGGNAG